MQRFRAAHDDAAIRRAGQLTLAADPREAKIASLLGATYEMLGHLGRGGFATVYRVRNLRLNRIEALKVLSADLEEPDFADRFRQEARMAASLDHPSIVKIFDYGQGEDLCWFTMQLVEGPTLIRELKQKGPWSEFETASLAISVADALDYSHRRGIVHRDIKPENILVDVDRRPYLMDFGIAKSEQSVVHTRTGTILGSPAYIAPEQLTGGGVDGRADIYSLGATLYRMVSNSFPFQDSDPVRMAMKRFTMRPEPLGPTRPGIDPVFEAIVMRCLEREPDARFATASELASALRNFLAGKPVPLPAPGVIGDETIAENPSGTPRAFSVPFPSAAAAAAAASGARAFPSGMSGMPPIPDSIPTIRTEPAGSSREPALPAEQIPPPRSRRSAVWTLLVGLAVAGAVVAYFATRSAERPVPGPSLPATRLGPVTAAPPSVSPGARLAAEPGVSPALPSSSSTSSSEPGAVRVPSPARAESVREGQHGRAERPPPRVRPTAVAALPREAPPPEPGRAVKPAQTESAAPIDLSTDVAREFANRSVGLAVVVAEDGSVKDARVISPLCPECDRAALASIRRYRFRPALDARGNPVQSRMAVPVIIPAPENP